VLAGTCAHESPRLISSCAQGVHEEVYGTFSFTGTSISGGSALAKKAKKAAKKATKKAAKKTAKKK